MEMQEPITYGTTEEEHVALHAAATAYPEPVREKRIDPYLDLLLVVFRDMGPHRKEWIDLILEALTHVTEEHHQALFDGPSVGVLLRRHYEKLLEKNTTKEKEGYERKVKKLLIEVFETGDLKPLLHAVGPVWRKWHQHTNTPRLMNESDRYGIVVSIAACVFQYELEVQQRLENYLGFLVDVLSEMAGYKQLGWTEIVVMAATIIEPEHYDELLRMGQTIGGILDNLIREVRIQTTESLAQDYSDDVGKRLVYVIQTRNIQHLREKVSPALRPFFDTSFPSAEEAEEDRQKFVGPIFEGYRYLEKVWTYHREDIQSRWTGMGKDERETILETSFPNLHDTFRKAVRNWSEHDQTGINDERMWKYAQMNKEELGHDTNLLSLIHIRATNPPDLFAFIDAEPFKVGYYLGLFRLQGLAGHTMIYRAQNTPETYGKAIPNRQKVPGGRSKLWKDATLWDSGTRAATASATGEGFEPEEGMVVYQVQARLYLGLAYCCRMLLSEDEQASLEQQPHPTTNKVKARDMQVQLPWPTAVSEALFYQPTYPLSLKHLIDQTESKRFHAEQHLWTLREDPSFFKTTIKEVHEHLPQNIKAKKGKGSDGGVTDLRFVEMAIKHAVVEAISSLFIWDAIKNRLIALHETLNDKRISKVKYNERLPQHVQEECVDLIQLLSFVQAGSAAFLKQCIFSSHRFRLNFQRNPAVENFRDDGGDIEVSNATRVVDLDNTIHGKFDDYVAVAEKARIRFAKTGVDERPVDLRGRKAKFERIFWNVLGSETHQGEAFDTNSKPIFFDELRRLVETEPEIRNVMTDYVQHQLLDMAFVADCYTHLYCFVPWSQTWAHLRTVRKEKTTAQYRTLIEPVQEIKDALVNTPSPMTTNGKNLFRELLRGFPYPFDEERTQQNVQVLQRAENALAEFWAWFDGIVDGIDPAWPPLLADLFRGNRVVYRTPDWVAPPAPADDGNRKRAAEDPPEEAPPAKRARGEGRARAPAPAPPQQQVPQYKFPVNRADLDVFHTIFHVPGQTHTRGELDWKDFCRAMTHIGFGLAPAGGGGSAFSFTPPAALTTGGSIVFHAPHHPSPKLLPSNYRAIGRRLGDHYNLKWDDFGLR